MTKFWIGIACKKHVENGVKLGICQFCHGKSSPGKRLSQGDFVIYYSSKQKMEEPDLYQKFTAIGTVKDDPPIKWKWKMVSSPLGKTSTICRRTMLI